MDNADNKELKNFENLTFDEFEANYRELIKLRWYFKTIMTEERETNDKLDSLTKRVEELEKIKVIPGRTIN